MRKLLYALTLLGTILAFGSCTGAPGRDGVDGRDGLDGFGVIKTIDLKVPQSSWNYSNLTDNNYFYAEVELPEVTESVFDSGLIAVYRTYDYDSQNASQVALPYVRPIEYEYNGNWYSYEEHVDYELFIGKMLIYYTASDFDYEVNTSFAPEAMRFRIVTIY